MKIFGMELGGSAGRSVDEICATELPVGAIEEQARGDKLRRDVTRENIARMCVRTFDLEEEFAKNRAADEAAAHAAGAAARAALSLEERMQLAEATSLEAA